jgi:uncharacterized protein (DUF1800 family)
MPTSRLSCLFWALLGAALLSASNPAIGQVLFANSFEQPFNIPANDAEAARFLNQATFGATASDIGAVRNQGISGWLGAQLNHPTTTLSRPWLEAYAAALSTGSVNQDARVHRWFNVAVTAPDQVRQRVAWALSQIVITSDRDDFLGGRPIEMAEWNDIIVRNALGNYRQLLTEVTFSPMMGRYLTTYRNRKFELVRSTSGGNTTFSAGNNGVQPDENYAREVMQLFSIGLVVRGEDFYTTFPDAANPGALRSTYTETDISELARVFTGLSYQCTQGTSTAGGVSFTRNCGANNSACTGIGCRFTNSGLFNANPPTDPLNRGLVHPDWYKPMVCYPRFHDNGRDTSGAILETDTGSFNLPAGTPTPNKTLSLGTATGEVNLVIEPSFLDGTPLNCHATGTTLNATQQQACVDYCEGSIHRVLDTLFNHPNTPPMVARQLIQRLVSSNPTPEYVQRVSDVFKDNGAGVRGDLKAVVRAILTDEEARTPPGAPGYMPESGKVREPMLKLVALWRHFGAVSGDSGVFPNQNPQGSPATANPLAGQPAQRRWGPTNPQNEYQQRPYGAPSVFNFYEPDYMQPGPVSDLGLFSPELQIIHEVTSVAAANDLYSRLCSGYGGGGNNCGSGALTGGPNNSPPDNRAFFPTAQVDLIPSVAPVNSTSGDPTVAQDTALIEFYNVRMMGGTMSGSLPATVSCPDSTGTGMKGELMKVIRCSGGLNASLNGGTSGTSGGDRQQRARRKALLLMHLIAISPEYSTQR